MINRLLSHLDAITRHRDHRLLDLSVLSALSEISGAERARALDLFHEKGDARLRERAAMVAGQASTPPPLNVPSQALLQFPDLCRALAERGDFASQAHQDGGHVTWFLIWQEDKVGSCLEIHTARALEGESCAMLRGVLAVHRNFQALLDYSERDSLTGLLNRKTFDERYARSMVAAMPAADAHNPERRHGGSKLVHCLAVVDIDHFKRVNDRFGHLYGDEVLILISNLLRSTFRNDDQIFRFGGEEFVLLISAASHADAGAAFERFRARVEAHRFPQIGQVTVSIGYSIMDQRAPVQVLGHADGALYHAKQHGRNRTCQYEDLVARALIAAPTMMPSVEELFE
jgi:diguanylate cyclase (GGDEF)-like protein